MTNIIEETFGVRVKPTVLYQGKPYIYPGDFSNFVVTEDVMQRDIRIQVPCNQGGIDRTVLFARSWIIFGKIDSKFKELLYGEEMTIGQIISAAALTVEYQNLATNKSSRKNSQLLLGPKGQSSLFNDRE